MKMLLMESGGSCRPLPMERRGGIAMGLAGSSAEEAALLHAGTEQVKRHFQAGRCLSVHMKDKHVSLNCCKVLQLVSIHVVHRRGQQYNGWQTYRSQTKVTQKRGFVQESCKCGNLCGTHIIEAERMRPSCDCNLLNVLTSFCCMCLTASWKTHKVFTVCNRKPPLKRN